MKKLDPRLKEVGKALKNARDERSMTQELMGKKLDVTHTTVGRYEKGELDMPLSTLFKYADVCDLNARIDLTKKTNGIEELMSLMESEITKSPATRKSSDPKLEVPEEAKKYMMKYEELKSDPYISKKTLKSLKSDIVEIVIETNKCDKDAIVRRLSAYAKSLEKMKNEPTLNGGSFKKR